MMFEEKNYYLINGDSTVELLNIRDNSIDSIVCDPPYEIGFMNKKFDKTGIAYNVDLWKQCLRVLKPGGYLLSFGATRTYHRMACAIEDAGFQIKDCIMWVYGSGFPKSVNVGKAYDKKLDNERKVLGKNPNHRNSDALFELGFQGGKSNGDLTIGNSIYEGFGTALKPSVEPIVMAQKPFNGTILNNVIEYGTGCINIDDCRVPLAEGEDLSGVKPRDITKLNTARKNETEEEALERKKNGSIEVEIALQKLTTMGRFPANLIHDGSDEVLELFPDKSNRFFYCPKASKKDRNEGCEDLEEKEIAGKGNGLGRICETCGASILNPCDCPERSFINPSVKNHHPTVKPTDLMRYLVRLVTPSDGIVLDPFLGSGSTGKAAILEGKKFIGIEMEEDYYKIAEKRIDFVYNKNVNENLQETNNKESE